ncbi:MAG: amidohydrolase family protein [Thermodesulfobacteriota bacterium]
MRKAFIGGIVIDGTGADPKPNTTVVVEGTKIVEISAGTSFVGEAGTFDVAGKTVMPGIIDTHVHYMPWMQWLISKQQYSLSYLIARGIAGMRALLDRGITTARDMGGLEIGICRSQEEGLIPGPRTKTVCVIIQASNGLTDLLPGAGGTITPQGITAFMPGLPSPWADGPDACRAKVREVLRYGGHFIKMANTAVPWHQPHLRSDRPLFTQAEVEAIVDEAHRAGTEVCCHVCSYTSSRAALEALKAGVDLIDHGTYLDDECIEWMVKRNVWYSPMFSVMKWHAEKNPIPYAREIAARCVELTKESFSKALKAGVRICMGTDHAYEIGWHGGEMETMVECGMTPMQAIVSSTKLGADALGMKDLVGTLEVGKEADLLVVDGDPLQNPAIVSDPAHLALVMQAGRPCSGPMVSQFAYEAPSQVMNQYF